MAHGGVRPGIASEEPEGGVPFRASSFLARPFQRREMLRFAGGAGALLLTGNLLEACTSGGGSTSSSSPVPINIGALKVTAGTTIPAATVKYGILPYGDNSMPVIGMRNGWFKDVGITVQPAPVGLEVQDNQVVPRLVNNEADIINWDGTVIVTTMAQAPQLKMIGFTDTYVGIYILASPTGGAVAVSDLMTQGSTFEAAMQQSVGQLVGKRVALDNTGYHRTFFNTVFKIGGITPSQMQLTTIDDSKMVQLAKAGSIDFASPAGAAQVVELLKLGWTPMVGVSDLLVGLPPGDPRAVGSLDHVGPAVNEAYYQANPETVLRLMSVNFRIVDAIVNEPDTTLPVQLPYLESVTGGSYTLADMKLIYSTIDPPTPFEKQTMYWTDTSNPQYYRNVYDTQIQSLQDGGVLPKNQQFNASQCIIGTEIYQTMLDLKTQYEKLAPQAKKATSQAAKTAAAGAALQASRRNYLDAVRFALAATSS